MSSDYRLSPEFGARLVGLLVVLLAVLVFVATGVVALLGLHTVLLVPVALVVVALILGLGAHLRRTPVVHLDAQGYRVRLIRGTGVKQADWREVEDALTATPRDIPCVVLRLTDGRTTTIPVAALDVHREVFVRDLQAHLQRGHGLRPLDGP